jgi:integrase
LASSTKTHPQQQYYRNFVESIRKQAARQTYDFHFKKFTQFIKGAEGNLLNENPRLIESRIIDYIIYLKNKGRSRSLISTAVCAISHFYTMNELIINKKKINKFVGTSTKKHKDIGYNTNQIRRLLEVCDDRIKVMVLMFASTGMSLGALPTLKMRNFRSVNIENDKQIKLYQITIYEGEPEEYITFCTPECSTAINSYLSYRERSGEEIAPNTPLIREQFDKDDIFKIKYPRQVLLGTISKILSEKLIQAGIREVEHIKENQTQGQSRKEIPLIHGFRKFFNTALMNSDVHPSFKKLLQKAAHGSFWAAG